jgi:hypothetical protein
MEAVFAPPLRFYMEPSAAQMALTFARATLQGLATTMRLWQQALQAGRGAIFVLPLACRHTDALFTALRWP